MQEALDDEFVHSRVFGKRQGFAHQTPETLAQGVVETLDVMGWTSGIRGLVLGRREHVVITCQLITMRATAGPAPIALLALGRHAVSDEPITCIVGTA